MNPQVRHPVTFGAVDRVESCQLGVHLAYAVPGTQFRALIDTELYLPESWADDRDRCRDATVPDDRKFRAKARLAQGMRQPRAWLGVVLAPDGADEDPRFQIISRLLYWRIFGPFAGYRTWWERLGKYARRCSMNSRFRGAIRGLHSR
jgi:DDE superfamily endonuclease